MMKKGLVLEGGAMRGMFTCGVLDVFLENNLIFDGAIGVSAGSAFGCNYKSKQPGRAIRYNKRFCSDWRYSSIRSLIKTGDLFGGEFCFHTLPDELDKMDYETYQKNPMEFWTVATDCNSGMQVLKELKNLDYNDLEFMRASASMPLVSRPVIHEGKTLLDGGMSSSIPLKQFENLGYEKNIVILTQPENYIKKPNSAMWLMKIALRKYPALLKAIKNRHLIYNDETKYAFSQQKLGSALVICPEKSLNISRTCRNPDELERVYQEGRKIAEKNLEKVKSFLS